jgi:acetyltransferase-like isoleucine patch superfamily enzyme
MSPFVVHVRRALKRLQSRIVVAIGGHDARLRLLRSQGMQIGKNCRIYTNNIGGEPYLIRVGDHVTITSGVRLVTHDGSCWILRERHPNLQDFGPIVIEDNCFIGVNAVILPHVRIGPNSIVAAGAVVTRDVPPNTVVGGVPAKALMPLDRFAEGKLKAPDAVSVPTEMKAQRRYLEEKYRSQLRPGGDKADR